MFNGQIHCPNGVNKNTSRILRRAFGYERPIPLNPQVSMGEKEYRVGQKNGH